MKSQLCTPVHESLRAGRMTREKHGETARLAEELLPSLLERSQATALRDVAPSEILHVRVGPDGCRGLGRRQGRLDLPGEQSTRAAAAVAHCSVHGPTRKSRGSIFPGEPLCPLRQIGMD